MLNNLTKGLNCDIKIYENEVEKETLRYLNVEVANKWLNVILNYKKEQIKLVLKTYMDNKLIETKTYK